MKKTLLGLVVVLGGCDPIQSTENPLPSVETPASLKVVVTWKLTDTNQAVSPNSVNGTITAQMVRTNETSTGADYGYSPMAPPTATIEWKDSLPGQGTAECTRTLDMVDPVSSGFLALRKEGGFKFNLGAMVYGKVTEKCVENGRETTTMVSDSFSAGIPTAQCPFTEPLYPMDGNFEAFTATQSTSCGSKTISVTVNGST